jgi:hypothetical protein
MQQQKGFGLDNRYLSGALKTHLQFGENRSKLGLFKNAKKLFFKMH